VAKATTRSSTPSDLAALGHLPPSETRDDVAKATTRSSTPSDLAALGHLPLEGEVTSSFSL